MCIQFSTIFLCLLLQFSIQSIQCRFGIGPGHRLSINPINPTTSTFIADEYSSQDEEYDVLLNGNGRTLETSTFRIGDKDEPTKMSIRRIARSSKSSSVENPSAKLNKKGIFIAPHSDVVKATKVDTTLLEKASHFFSMLFSPRVNSGEVQQQQTSTKQQQLVGDSIAPADAPINTPNKGMFGGIYQRTAVKPVEPSLPAFDSTKQATQQTNQKQKRRPFGVLFNRRQRIDRGGDRGSNSAVTYHPLLSKGFGHFKHATESIGRLIDRNKHHIQRISKGVVLGWIGKEG